MYSISRLCEPCLEHIDNNFNPLDAIQKGEFSDEMCIRDSKYDIPLQPQTPSFAGGNNIHTFMETIYLCIIIFLFVLARFDLIVGVSNDAVNFCLLYTSPLAGHRPFGQSTDGQGCSVLVLSTGFYLSLIHILSPYALLSTRLPE